MSGLNYPFLFTFLVFLIHSGSSSTPSGSNSLFEDHPSPKEVSSSLEHSSFFTFTHSEAEEVTGPIKKDTFLDDEIQADGFLAALILKHLNLNQPNKFEDELEEVINSAKYGGPLREILRSNHYENGPTLRHYLFLHGIFFFADPILREWGVTSSLITLVLSDCHKYFAKYHESVKAFVNHFSFVKHFSYDQFDKDIGHALLDLILNRSIAGLEKVEIEYRRTRSFSEAFNIFVKELHNRMDEKTPLHRRLYSLTFTPSQVNLAFEAYDNATSGSGNFMESINVIQSPENYASFEEEFQFSKELIRKQGLSAAIANHRDNFFLNRIIKAITYIVGESKFELFSKSLHYLRDFEELNVLARVLYRYFKREPQAGPQPDVNVILRLDGEKKLILSKWQNAICGFSGNLAKSENLYEIHESLLYLHSSVERRIFSVLSVLSVILYKAIFLEKCINDLLVEYTEREGDFLVNYLTEMKTSKGISLYDILTQKERIFESFYEISKLDCDFLKKMFQISTPLSQEDVNMLFYFSETCQRCLFSLKIERLAFNLFLRRKCQSEFIECYRTLSSIEKSSLVKLSALLTNGATTFDIEIISQELEYDRKTVLLKRLAEIIVAAIKAKKLYLPAEVFKNFSSIYKKEGLEIKVIQFIKSQMLPLEKVFEHRDIMPGFRIIDRSEPFNIRLFDFIGDQLKMNFPKHKASRILKFFECLPLLSSVDPEILFNYSIFGEKTRRSEIEQDIAQISYNLTNSSWFETWQQRFLGYVELKDNGNSGYEEVRKFLWKLQFSKEELELARLFAESLQEYSHAEFSEKLASHLSVDMDRKLRVALLKEGLIMTMLNNRDDRFIKKMVNAFEMVTSTELHARLARYLYYLPMLSSVFYHIPTPDGRTSLHNILIGGYLGRPGVSLIDIGLIASLDIQSRVLIGLWQSSLIWFKNELGDPNVKDTSLIFDAIHEMKFNFITRAMFRYVPVPQLRGYLNRGMYYRFPKADVQV